MTRVRIPTFRMAALLAALALGGTLPASAWAQAATPATAAPTSHAMPAKAHKAQPVHMAAVHEDAMLYTPVPGAVYKNGGVGENSEQMMRKEAHQWPLRMTFSEHKDDEFVANVGLKVFNQKGEAVLRLKDAGPMTYVKVPEGNYRITAHYKDHTESRTVHVGAKGADANFHWMG